MSYYNLQENIDLQGVNFLAFEHMIWKVGQIYFKEYF